MPDSGDRGRSDLARSALAEETLEGGSAAGTPPAGFGRRVGDDWTLTERLHAEHGRGDPFAAAVRATRMPMIVCDPRQPDSPIVFANGAFLRMTGYALEEVLGRNCRFLQGPDTDRGAVAEVRDAIAAHRDVHVELLNYRRDGTPFWNALYVSPVIGESGETQFFFASQLDVTERKQRELSISEEKDRFEAAVRERTASLEEALAAKVALLHEVDHRVKNNMQTISALVAMEARAARDPAIRDAFGRLMRRVEAVATVHRRLYEEDAVDRFDVSGFAVALAEMLAGTAPCDVAVEPPPPPLLVPAASATPLALLLNEIVLDAGAGAPAALPGERRPRLVLSIEAAPDGAAGRFRIVAAAEAAGTATVDADAAPAVSASRTLIGRLVRQLRGTVAWSGADPGMGGHAGGGGTRTVIDLPVETATPRAGGGSGGEA